MNWISAVHQLTLMGAGLLLTWVAFSGSLERIGTWLVGFTLVSSAVDALEIYSGFDARGPGVFLWLGVTALVFLVFAIRRTGIVLRWGLYGVLAAAGLRAVDAATQTDHPLLAWVKKANVVPVTVAPSSLDTKMIEDATLLSGVDIPCGVPLYKLDLGLEQPASVVTQNAIRVEECGFFPPLLKGTIPKFVVHNNLKHSVHLYYSIKKKGKFEAGWELVVPPGSSQESPLINLKPDEVGILYSGLEPKLGVVTLVDGSSHGKWLISREPLIVRRQDFDSQTE